MYPTQPTVTGLKAKKQTEGAGLICREIVGREDNGHSETRIITNFAI